jgi:hypothetical protein
LILACGVFALAQAAAPALHADVAAQLACADADESGAHSTRATHEGTPHHAPGHAPGHPHDERSCAVCQAILLGRSLGGLPGPKVCWVPGGATGELTLPRPAVVVRAAERLPLTARGPPA